MMACLLVMLPQQVFSIIVTIRRPYDCVNVVLVMILVLRKRLAGLMVELAPPVWQMAQVGTFA